MRIRDLRLETGGPAPRASASIEWEDSPRPARRLTFSARGELASAFEPTPEAFVLSTALAASRAGERRLRIDSPLCSVFGDGLRAALALLDAWYGGSRASLALEAAGGFHARQRGAPAAAMFLSGGADSLHLLRRNRLVFPGSHPDSFRVAIHVCAFGFAGGAAEAEAQNLWERASCCVRRIADAEGLALVVVETDARLLDPDHEFFVTESHASLLAATAHLFPGSFRSASIAASADLRQHYRPWGSHPLLDPLFGSAAVAVRHSGHQFARLEKIEELSRWDLALATLLVCNEAPLPPGVTNCGRCEKCMRTQCELLAAGALDRASTFAARKVTADSIRRLQTVDNFAGHSWWDLPRGLSHRPDLVAAVKDWIERLQIAADWKNDRGWKGNLRRFDRAFLGGRLLAFRRRRRRTA